MVHPGFVWVPPKIPVDGELALGRFGGMTGGKGSKSGWHVSRFLGDPKVSSLSRDEIDKLQEVERQHLAA